MGHYKKFQKAEEAIDGDEDDLLLCLFMMSESKKEIKKKTVRFVEDVKQPLEAGMMCTIDGDTFFSFTKNTWIGDSGASCHITNNNTGLYDITDIDKSIQGSSSLIHATKKGKLRVKVWQVDGTEQVHILWPVKCCPKVCELLQGNKISSDHQNNIVVKTPTGNIILDHQIKTHDSWVAKVDFL